MSKKKDNINLVAFGVFSNSISFEGVIFSLFVIGLGAVEVAIALYIFYGMYKKNNSVDIEDYRELW